MYNNWTFEIWEEWDGDEESFGTIRAKTDDRQKVIRIFKRLVEQGPQHHTFCLLKRNCYDRYNPKTVISARCGKIKTHVCSHGG